uniref:Interleukin 1 receptor associated kinase 3 n=1 Tax=Gorilla gorilla gorilla TaxID=9595 RepID=A0A2I2Y8G8_GORGO
MAGNCGARGALSAHTLLFDLPPALLGELCAVLDSCDGALGWRGLVSKNKICENGVLILQGFWHVVVCKYKDSKYGCVALFEKTPSETYLHMET